MAALTRVKQLIFGSGAATAQFGKIGSKSAGTPINTKDLAQIQSLSQFLNGLYAITANAVNPPYIQDLNSLYLLLTSQLAYVFEKGIPEWESGTDYFSDVSFVQVSGVLYQATADSNNKSPPGNVPAFWKSVDPATIAANLATEISRATAAEALLAPKASPAFTGNPTAPTQSPGDNSTKVATTAYADTSSGLGYVQTAVTESGLTWDAADSYILSKAEIANRLPIGTTFHTDIPLTQTHFSAARSTANPGFPQYNPVISRSVDKTITNAMATPLVTLFRGYAASFLGNASFAGTVVGSVWTATSITTAVTAMLTAIQNEALVRRWFSSNQSANYAVSGGDFTGISGNVNSVDFAITAVNVGTGAITFSGSPTAGAQTLILYPYRIVGSTTSIFLPRLSGFVPAGEGDFDGMVVNGYRFMDYGQDHGHTLTGNYTAGAGVGNPNPFSEGDTTGGPLSSTTAVTTLVAASGGTPRTGKNTTPRTVARNFYTHAGVLTAAA